MFSQYYIALYKNLGIYLFKKAVELIENSSYISLITHLNVDADSYASAVALLLFLERRFQKKVKIINKDVIPSNLQKLYPQERVKKEISLDSDLLIFIDCGDLRRAGIKDTEIKAPIITIDHHILKERFADVELVDPTLVSTAILVYKLLKFTGKKIDKEVAQALFCAIASDSQFFSLDRSDKECYLIASELIGLGASVKDADTILNKSDSLAKFRLRNMALLGTELALEGALALTCIDENMFRRSGGLRSDTEGLVDIPLSIECVEVSVVIIEMQGYYKISLRSKNIDILKVAESFDGGGHKKAAGCRIYLKDINGVKKVIIEKIKEVL